MGTAEAVRGGGVRRRVLLAGQDAPVAFSGLTPGLPGLYQINVTVPAGVAAGSLPVTLKLGGVTASATIPGR